MPSVSLYIKEDDYDKWKSIEKKADFVSDAINERHKLHSMIDKSPPLKILKEEDPYLEHALKIPGVKRASDTKLCKHFQPKGKCLQKKRKHIS